MIRLLILATVVATSCGPPNVVGDHLTCSYVPRETPENPFPELDTFENCAVREGVRIRILTEHLEALYFGDDDLSTILIDKQYYYIKQDGTKAPVVTWDNGADYFSDGLARTMIDGKIAYIDKDFKVVLAPLYDYAWPFENGVAMVCEGCRAEKLPGGEHTPMLGGAWGFIDKAGAEVVPVRYSSHHEAYDALRQTQADRSRAGST